jgi:mono/diheme cytochrome c family protein
MRKTAGLLLFLSLTFALSSCTVERRKSDAELGLNAQQSTGRGIFDNRCARCHEAYSRKELQGPSLKALFKKPYMSNGLPANDDRVKELIRYGRSKMPAYGQILDQQQLDDLMAYLHTL